MLERLVNEDREGAEELFHEIVVEKSREIYQSILESEDEEVDEADDEDLDEADDDEELEEAEEDDDSDDENLDEMFGLDEFAPGNGSDAAMGMGGDATDDMMGDMGVDGMDGDDDIGGDMEGDTDSRLQDLEDALDELKAEFDAMMSGDEGEEGEEGDEDEMDFGDEEGEEGDEDEMDFGDEEGEEKKEDFAFEAKKDMKKDAKKEKKSAGEEMREYVEKVNGGFGAKIGGDNGTNTKSIVAAKNDMGGTTANILRTDTEQGVESAKGQLKGSSLFKGTAKEDNAGNVNVPGGKAGKTAFKKSEPGHGAERKGKPETADKGAVSTLTKLSSRAK